MKVSVLTITYNQEKYIAQAIDSILMQQVDFDYEIVIGEDASTDRTREIVLEFARKYPDRIRVLLRDAATAEHDRAHGISGKANFVNGLQSCRGKYVAFLDGDDYWTDVHKLRKLVAYLERHVYCSLCYHQALVVYENGSPHAHRLYPPNQKEISTLEDLLKAGTFPVTSTIMFRNSLLGTLPVCFNHIANGDWMLDVLLAERGNLGYFDEVMSVYRVHSGGVGSRLNQIQRTKLHIKSYKIIDAYLNYKYHPVLDEKIGVWREFMGQQSRQEARSSLEEYRSLVRKGRLRRGLRMLWEAANYAPAEVFRPRRFAGIVKNGLVGIFHKLSAQS